MSKKTDSVIDLAKQLAQKEIESGDVANTPELLDALSTVATALKAKSGNDASILSLVAQVEKIVKAQKA
jgi:hypothetical protein